MDNASMNPELISSKKELVIQPQLVNLSGIRYDEKGNSFKGANTLGKAASNRDDQVLYLKQRLNMFLEVLDSIDPEHTDLEDIDRLIGMIDDLEMKVDQFKK
jgi:hypothetical protein